MKNEKLSAILSALRLAHPRHQLIETAVAETPRTRTLEEVIVEAEKQLETAIQNRESVSLIQGRLIHDEIGSRIRLPDGTALLENFVNTAFLAALRQNYDTDMIDLPDVVKPVIPIQMREPLDIDILSKVPLFRRTYINLLRTDDGRIDFVVFKDRYAREDMKTGVGLDWRAEPIEVLFPYQELSAAITGGELKDLWLDEVRQSVA